MRDPAVLALYAVRVTAKEFASIRAGAPIVRPYWPPGRCRGAVVGLQVGGDVLGEALLAGTGPRSLRVWRWRRDADLRSNSHVVRMCNNGMGVVFIARHFA